MDNKKTIKGRKESVNFFGHIGLILDKVRLRTIKANSKDEEKSNYIYNLIMKIKNDDIKIEAISLSSMDEWDKSEIIETISDDIAKIRAIMNLEDEVSRENALGSVKGFNGIENLAGRREILETTIELFGTEGVLENIQKQIEEEEELESILNQDEIIEKIKGIKSKFLQAKLARTLVDDDKKIDAIKLIKDDSWKAYVARSIENDDKKIDAMTLINSDYAKVSIAETILDDNKRIQSISLISNNVFKIQVLKTIQDDDKKIEWLKNAENKYAKVDLARSINNDDKKVEAIEFLEDENDKIHVAHMLKDINKEIYFMMKYCSYEELESFYFNCKNDRLIKDENLKKLKDALERAKKSIKTNNDDEKIEFIRETDNENLKIEIAKTIKNDDKKWEALTYMDNNPSRMATKISIIDGIKNNSKKIERLQQFSVEDLRDFRAFSEDIEFIKDNIELFIEKEGLKGKIPEGIIDELYAENNSVVKTINFRILTPNYIEVLGKNKINLISCYPDVQEQLLLLDDKQCYLFSKCIDNYAERMDTDEWTVLASQILRNIIDNQYNELIGSITNLEELSQQDLECLTQVLQNDNWCEITDIDQVRNFESINTEICNQIMYDEKSSLPDKKEALLRKIFGHDYKYAKSIIDKFGEDIENIQDGDAKNYVQALKLIETLDDEEIIKRIFDECLLVRTDKVVIERSLRNEYWKTYNEDLYSPQKNDLVDEKLNIYEAGLDFKIIMTSVGAFHENNAKNYKEDWNRPEIGTQHFCASYIRNDMIGTAPINNICYGFSDMREDALMLSGNRDICSSKNNFVSKPISEGEKYYTSEQQINNTLSYNEMDFRRIQGEEKKQPDYILVFRKNGKIPNMKEALKASKQWDKKPIVIVDIDKCLENERQKVDGMFEQYSSNPKLNLAEQIKQKVRNNRVTDSKFCQDIQDRLLQLETTTSDKRTTESTKVETEEPVKSEVTKKDLEENYGMVNANDRKTEMSRIRSILQKIRNIAKEAEHGE